jgi:signal transduction histidine kinase/CheY-like chemotaxis protein
VHWLSARGRFHYEDDGRPVRMVGVVRDVTAQRHAEESRRRLERELRQSQKMESIGTLAGGIAHDFNNVLGAILGNAELASMDLPEAHPAAEGLQEIVKASIRARDLIRQILAFTRQQEATRNALPLEGIVSDVLGLLRASIPASIVIRTYFDPDCPRILADESQMDQVVINLCTNAVHAMSPHGGVLELRVAGVIVTREMSDEDPHLSVGRYARLVVRDSGRGMSAAVKERIFEPFFTTKARGEGTGLGLSVVHGIVQNHEGTITVSSEPHIGSTFTLDFPAAPSGVVDVGPRDVSIPRGHGERVLLVDDEAPLVAFGTAALERLGYRVLGFTDVLDAVDALQARPEDFDIVITDLSMPGMTGTEFAEIARRLRPGLPVVLTTGYAGGLDVEKVRRHGVRELILKPAVLEVLAATIRGVLDAPFPAETAAAAASPSPSASPTSPATSPSD